MELGALRKNASTKSMIHRAGSVESCFPVNFSEQLLTLPIRKIETNNTQMDERQEELKEELRLKRLRRQGIAMESGMKQILTELITMNMFKKQQLKRYNVVVQVPVVKVKDIKLDQIEQSILEQKDITQSLMLNIAQLEKSTRCRQNECKQFEEQLIIYNSNFYEVEQKQQQSEQIVQIAMEHQRHIEQTLQADRNWQIDKFEHMQENQKLQNKQIKDELTQLCERESRISMLQEECEQMQQQIQKLDEEINMKFDKIEECGEFLDELDDFDKLVLIFVYESPDEFNLSDILEQIKYQLAQPMNKNVLAYTQQEYIDQARFSSVSSRINIFFRFHKNNLRKNVNSLVQVYNKLQIEDQTYNNRYHDLLVYRTTLVQELSQLNMNQQDITMKQQHLDMLETAGVSSAMVGMVDYNICLLIRLFSGLTNTISRIVNALQDIKEVLKSCPSKAFNGDFYLRWTYNKIYTKMAQVQTTLEQQFQIKITAIEPSIRNSNQLLNAIYDNLESKKSGNKKKTVYKHQPLIASSQLIQDTLNQHVLLQQFLTQTELNTLSESTDPISALLTKGYELAYERVREQIWYLMQILQEAIIDCASVDEATSPARLLNAKYNLKELLDKNSTYEYKPKVWKKELLDNKIKSYQPYQDIECVKSVDGIDSAKQITNTSMDTQIQQPPPPPTDAKQLIRYINNIGSKIPSSTNSLTAQLILNPVFTQLHHKNRKLRNQHKITHEFLQPITNNNQELASKKSLPSRKSLDFPSTIVQTVQTMQTMQTMQTNQTTPQIQKSTSRCPKVIGTTSYSYTSPRNKCNTQTSDHAISPASGTGLNYSYGSANKVLRNFFNNPLLRK